LLGDPGAAVAVADWGGSDSSHSGGGNRWDHGGIGAKRGGPKWGVGIQRDRGDTGGGVRGIIKFPKPEVGIPRITDGSDRDDNLSDAQRAVRAARDAGPGNSRQVSENMVGESSPVTADRSPTTADANADSATDPRAEPPGAPMVGPSPPRVAVGNGRSPAAQLDPPSNGIDDGVPPEAAPVGTPRLAVPPPAPSDARSVPRLRLPVPYLDALRAGDPTGPLLGTAGLILIPLAGAALGYRQARAAQAADTLSRTSG
jgi:hypothetical protein